MSFLSSMLERSAKRRMMSDLLKLDDHLLRDIGLNRHELRSALVARGTAAITAQHVHA